MEAKPKISTYLILIVVLLFLFLGITLYGLLLSEEIARYSIRSVAVNFVKTKNIDLRLGDIKGCFLDGIEVDKVEVRQVNPRFEATAKKIKVKPYFSQIWNRGAIEFSATMESLDCKGFMKVPDKVASVPPFIGPECLLSLPSNIKIKEINIKEIKFIPFFDNFLEIYSSGLRLNSIDGTSDLELLSSCRAVWKENILAKASFKGVLDQHKNKINGKLVINAAKQVLETELNVSDSRRGTELSGYVASQTLINLQPLSPWLGYLWQIDKPYAISGTIGCQGSWLYNSEVGFFGNLSGKYEKIEASFMGLFFKIFELNGDWKLFDGNLTLLDKGSELLGFPAFVNGKIESALKANRKFDLTINCNSLPLDKLTASLPWVVRYSNGIPELAGMATLSVNLLGNRPMVNGKLELMELCQTDKNPSFTKVGGKIAYSLPELGSGTVDAKLYAETEKGLPLFFKRFSNNMYAIESKNAIASSSYRYVVKSSVGGKIRLNGNMTLGDSEVFRTVGELQENDRFYLKSIAKGNRVYNLEGADPIDLLLMR